jgi:D-alanine-D-alanine ligase
MRIGLTYDLREDYLAAGYGLEETAEFDREDTIAAIESALRFLGHETDRIGRARRLVERLAAGDRWDLVFNIAEGMNGLGREAQVPAILDVYGIPYTFSDPLVMSLTLHKGMTKRVIRDAGLATPPFQVVEGAGDVRSVDFPPPYFLKPVAEGTSKGITADSIVRRPGELAGACARLLASFHQPVLVERFLPGREFTVGLAGTGSEARVLGTLEVHLLAGADAGVYSYENKARYEERVAYRRVLPEGDEAVREAEVLALGAWRLLGCRDAGRVDLRCDGQGRPQFVEVNPLAGLHPVHSDLPILCREMGLPYSRLIEAIVQSAARRIGGMRLRAAEATDANRSCA